jgi:hypothetical protein
MSWTRRMDGDGRDDWPAAVYLPDEKIERG